MAELQLVTDDGEVAEHRLELTVGAEGVPGLLWTPSGTAETAGPRRGDPRPTVLIGHGRGGHKRWPRAVALARQFVVGHRWAAVALDAPEHGERRKPGADPHDFPPRPDPDQVVAEMTACVDFLVGERILDPAALGYLGLSMGTAMGIPFIAAEPRVRCAVLGLMHSRSERVRADAARVSCPVLFLMQLEDERVPRSEGLELFDAIASADKRLHAHPGRHGEMPEEEMTAAERFLTSYLTVPSTPSTGAADC
jgi:dienelactone hydrolase